MHLLKQRQQGFVFHLIPPLNLTNNQFRVKGDGKFGATKLQSFVQAKNKRPIFGNIVGAGPRITSYNVCYTKLLRMMRWPRGHPIQ